MRGIPGIPAHAPRAGTVSDPGARESAAIRRHGAAAAVTNGCRSPGPRDAEAASRPETLGKRSVASGRCRVDADEAAPQGPIWRGAEVLVVDDDTDVRELTRRTLEEQGFYVSEASDGEAALRVIQARAEPFDLVLTDLSMPRIDGRRVSETVRRYRPSVAVLCMSADPDAVPYIESSDTPVRVLLKPFTSEDLYHAVRDAISRSADLTAAAEAEIVRAHAGLSQLALALDASRTVRVHLLDLVVAARELRRATARVV
jgi:DNA-binding response OmpR family regulator